MSFKNIQPGDRVTYLRPNGTKLVRSRTGYRTVQEYKKATHKVNPLLIFSTHVVVNAGGRHGIPQVVDEGNFISAKPARKALTSNHKEAPCSNNPLNKLSNHTNY